MCLSPFLKTGTIDAARQSLGMVPLSSESWNMHRSIDDSSSANSWRTLAGISSGPVVLCHNDAPTKAEILNQQCHSVYTKEDTSNISDMGNSPHQDMQDLNISEEGVRKLLKNIRLSSLMVLPLANHVASLSGMTKISLVHCVCHQARCHRCTCHGRFVTLVAQQEPTLQSMDEHYT
jgi:hypothetical protein